jgi:toxin ParE1/3/4
MPYRVELTARAASDLEFLFLYVHAGESAAAARWFNALERAIESLSESPGRCAAAPEKPLRQLLYGRKPHVYRILFRIGKDAVTVVHIRHGASLPNA